MAAAVRSFIRRHPDWFEPRYLTPNQMFRLYRVKIPPG